MSFLCSCSPFVRNHHGSEAVHLVQNWCCPAVGYNEFSWFTVLRPFDAFCSNFRSCNPLEAEYNNYVNLLKNGMTTEQAVVKMKLSKPPPTVVENYQYLQKTWKLPRISIFEDLLRLYTNKDVVLFLEATQKATDFYREKNIDMLKLGCTLANLANNCLHNSTDTKLYPITDADKNMLERNREDVVGGISIIFTRKAVVDETFSHKFTNACKSFVEDDAADYIHIQFVNPCPPVLILVGITIQRHADSQLNKRRPVALKIWSCPIFDGQDQIAKSRDSVQQADKQKLTASVLMVFVLIGTLALRPWAAFITFVCVKKFNRLSSNNVVVRRESSMNWDEAIYKKKASLLLKYVIAKGGDCTKQAIMSKIVSEILFLQTFTCNWAAIRRKKNAKLFVYVQCDSELLENIKNIFANFPPIFKNALVSRNDIGDSMQTHAEEDGITFQRRKMLISGFTLQNGSLMTLSANITAWIRSCLYKSSSLRWVHSKKVFQQLHTVISRGQNSEGRESQFKFRCRENEATN